MDYLVDCNSCASVLYLDRAGDERRAFFFCASLAAAAKQRIGLACHLLFAEKMAHLILASSSPRRNELLSQLGLTFDIYSPDIDESILHGETAAVYVERLARMKAKAVQMRFPDAVIVAADTSLGVEGPRAKRLKAPKVSRIKGLMDGLKGQLESTPRVIYELSQTVMKDMGRNPDYVSSFQAPSSILNQRVSSSRRFAAQSFEFARLAHIAKELGVTINDIVLAICSGALREYLISQNALPKKTVDCHGSRICAYG